MDVITYTHARQNLAEVMDRACDTGEPVIIKRAKKRAVVLLSLAEWRAWKETIHIMSNPRNAQHILDGIEAFKRGEFVVRDLIDPAPAEKPARRKSRPAKAVAAE